MDELADSLGHSGESTAGRSEGWQQTVDEHAAAVWRAVRDGSSSKEEAVAVFLLIWLRLEQRLRTHPRSDVGAWLQAESVRECRSDENRP